MKDIRKEKILVTEFLYNIKRYNNTEFLNLFMYVSYFIHLATLIFNWEFIE